MLYRAHRVPNPTLAQEAMSGQASLLLMKQLKGAHAARCSARRLQPTSNTPASLVADLNKHPVEGFSAGLVDEGNVFEWEIMIMGPPDTH